MKGEPMSQKPSFPLMKRGDIQSQKEKSHTEAIYPEISPSVSGETAKVFANAIERLFYSDSFRIGKAVLPQANVRSRLWDLDAVILQSVEGKLKSNQQDVRNSTAYTMAVIFNTICEAHSDLLVDPYLNQLALPSRPGGGAPC